MGLTIHYGLKLNTTSRKKALAKVQELHRFASTLPFAELDDIVTLSGDEANYERDRGGNEDHLWLKIQASQHLRDPSDKRCFVCVSPSECIAFPTWPGEGCESANFGLCRFPKTITVDGREIPTRMATGWRWSSFCKTQYASNVNTAHFLRCHIILVKMLDKAKEIGFDVDVSDEGEYWENRNVAKLAECVGEHNVMIAGLTGQLKDLLGDDGDVVAPITERGDFEHLEADAQTKPPFAKD